MPHCRGLPIRRGRVDHEAHHHMFAQLDRAKRPENAAFEDRLDVLSHAGTVQEAPRTRRIFSASSAPRRFNIRPSQKNYGLTR